MIRSIILSLCVIMLTGCRSIPIPDDTTAQRLFDYAATRLRERLASGDLAVPDTSPDAIVFSSLQWRYGGFSGAGAILGEPRISNLRVTSAGMSISWDVDLSVWGVAHTDHTRGVACFFVRVDGQWIGGKFEWISSSRSTRQWHNINNGYGGWQRSVVDRADAYAFVVVGTNGQRSNIIIQERQ